MKIICQLHFRLLAAAVVWFQAMQGDAGAGAGEIQLSFFNYENSSQLQACFYRKKNKLIPSCCCYNRENQAVLPVLPSLSVPFISEPFISQIIQG